MLCLQASVSWEPMILYPVSSYWPGSSDYSLSTELGLPSENCFCLLHFLLFHWSAPDTACTVTTLLAVHLYLILPVYDLAFLTVLLFLLSPGPTCQRAVPAYLLSATSTCLTCLLFPVPACCSPAATQPVCFTKGHCQVLLPGVDTCSASKTYRHSCHSTLCYQVHDSVDVTTNFMPIHNLLLASAF